MSIINSIRESLNYVSASGVLLFVGLIISILQWQSNSWKRKNDLFDRRYNFYKTLESWWIYRNHPPPDEPPAQDIEPEDVIPFAIEAEFLFGKDISKHIYSFREKPFPCTPWYVGEDFIKPFKKYLTLR